MRYGATGMASETDSSPGDMTGAVLNALDAADGFAVPGFDAVCRMVQAGMGVGVLPLKVYEIMGRSLGLVAVRLDDAWAERSLVLVARDPDGFSPVARQLYEHLRSVESSAG